MDQNVARPRRTFAGLAAMALGAVALVGAFPAAANATGGPDGGGHGGGGNYPPSVGSPCPDEDFWYWHWGPHNQDEVPGEHTEDDQNIDPSSRGGDITFTISNIRAEGEHMAFDFTSSVPVEVVFAKGYSDDGYTNEYGSAVTEGTARTGDGDTTYIKHVILCPVPEMPTTTTVPETTTTTHGTTTTVPETTTTTQATTTTEAPTTSSSVAPTTPTTAPTTTISSGGGLPVTGSNTGLLLGIGGLLLLAGGGFLVARRQLGNRSV